MLDNGQGDCRQMSSSDMRRYQVPSAVHRKQKKKGLAKSYLFLLRILLTVYFRNSVLWVKGFGQ